MILGGDWVKIHNPVLLDFIEYMVQVTHKGKRVELRGIYHQSELKSLTAKGVKQLFRKGKSMWAHLFTISAEEVQLAEVVPEELKEVLK